MKLTGNYAKEQWGEHAVMPMQLMTGILCALVSHPFDTTATTMQRYGYTSSYEAAKYLSRQPNPLKAFYRGASPRAALFTVAAVTITNVSDMVRNVLEDNTVDNKKRN
jgi:hypothetical protein